MKIRRSVTKSDPQGWDLLTNAPLPCGLFYESIRKDHSTSARWLQSQTLKCRHVCTTLTLHNVLTPPLGWRPVVPATSGVQDRSAWKSRTMSHTGARGMFMLRPVIG